MHSRLLMVIGALRLCSGGIVSAQTMSPAPTDDTQIWSEVKISPSGRQNKIQCLCIKRSFL